MLISMPLFREFCLSALKGMNARGGGSKRGLYRALFPAEKVFLTITPPSRLDQSRKRPGLCMLIQPSQTVREFTSGFIATPHRGIVVHEYIAPAPPDFRLSSRNILKSQPGRDFLPTIRRRAAPER